MSVSEFQSMIEAGFAEALTQIGDTITVGAKTARCVRTPFPQAVEYQLNGKLVTLDSEVDILRTEVTRLAITDRTECTIGGKSLRVVRIDDDENDPCLKLVTAAAR